MGLLDLIAIMVVAGLTYDLFNRWTRHRESIARLALERSKIEATAYARIQDDDDKDFDQKLLNAVSKEAD